MSIRKPMTWQAFLMRSLAASVGILLLLFAFVVAMNPYGNVPVSLPLPYAAMDSNERFMYPGIIRTGDYDSLVLGTSTAQLLDPRDLSRKLPGRFANLAMSAATAWEQFRLGDLFLRRVRQPETLLVAVDDVWCKPDADTNRFTRWNFPEWLYDESWLNDLPYLLNEKTVEIATRQLGHHLGWDRSRYAPDGYAVFTPPEASYDPARASAKIWHGIPRPMHDHRPPFQASRSERDAWRFPALAWMEDLLRRVPANGLKLVVFMPAHIAGQPNPGTRAAARLEECKRRMAAIGKRTGSYVIDFNVRSSITRDDTNYWDRQHYRLPIGRRIIDNVARAVAGGPGPSDATLRILTHPRGNQTRQP